MTIVKHELRQGKLAFLIWTGAIGALLATCVFLFPEMKGEMEGVSDLFSSMGSFTAAFGMAGINISDMTNKSRGEYAYTMIDTEKPADSSIIEQLNSIKGVFRVRVVK